MDVNFENIVHFIAFFVANSFKTITAHLKHCSWQEFSPFYAQSVKNCASTEFILRQSGEKYKNISVEFWQRGQNYLFLQSHSSFQYNLRNNFYKII